MTLAAVLALLLGGSLTAYALFAGQPSSVFAIAVRSPAGL